MKTYLLIVEKICCHQKYWKDVYKRQAVQFSPVEWEDGKASTVITTSEEGYTLQQQIGGIEEEKWIDTTNEYEITGLTLGQTVYGRLFNGTEGSKTADITVEDLDAPSASWLFTDTNVQQEQGQQQRQYKQMLKVD